MTRILVAADVHGNARQLARAVAAQPEASAVLIAGDITNFGTVHDAKSVLEAAGADGRIRTVVVVSGNCDPKPVRDFLAESGCDLERSGPFPGLPAMAGVGGGLRRAGVTCHERTEEDLGKALRSRLSTLGEGTPCRAQIIMTHSPPYGTNADKLQERHVGSRAFADILAQCPPRLWICGHIHESRCSSFEDGTLILNPGPMSWGKYAIVDFGGETEPDAKVSNHHPAPGIRVRLFG